LNRLFITGLVVCLLGAAAPAQATDRPRISVSFELAERRLQNAFQPAQRQDLEARAAAVIAQRLGERIGFVSFSAAAPAAPQVLKVRLEAAPGSSQALFKETLLRLELTGPGLTPRSLSWRFRPEERYGDPTGGVEALVREIELRLRELDDRALIQDVMSQVAIAHEAQVWQDPLGWVIPYRKTELCLDFRSLLRIESMLPSGAGPVLREFLTRASADFDPPGTVGGAAALRGRLFTQPEAGAEGVAELRRVRPEDVSIRGIYVVEYRQLAPCAGPVPLDAVDFRGSRP
jgi:hypothetical protein